MIVLSCQQTRTALFSLVGPNRVQNIEEPMKIFSTNDSLRLSMLILVLQDLKHMLRFVAMYYAHDWGATCCHNSKLNEKAHLQVLRQRALCILGDIYLVAP